MKRMYLVFAALLCMTLTSGCGAQGKVEIKTFSILGDSYSTFEGHIPEGNACWYFPTPQGDNDVVNAEQTWWHLFKQKNGYKLLINDSYSGSTICNTGYNGVDYSDRSFIHRMTRIAADQDAADLIIIFGGTNDSWANSPIGELIYENWTSEDLYCCLPACCFMLDYLKKNAKKSEIVFIINSELKAEITEGIEKACEHYGIHCLLLKDIEKKSGHPSILGMRQICSQLSSFIDSL